MARLYPYFKDVWESKYAEEPLKRKIGTLSRLAHIYESYEEMSKLINPKKKDARNTVDLDKLFFVSKNLSDIALATILPTLSHELAHTMLKKGDIV
jgi:hypothetical protein